MRNEINNIQRQIWELQAQQGKLMVQAIEDHVQVEDVKIDLQDVKFARMNKKCDIREYRDEVEKGDYVEQDVKIVRKVIFADTNEGFECFNDFCSNLMADYSFLDGMGGSSTDDPRIKEMQDFYSMEKEERATVKWYRDDCVLVVCGEYQYVCDPQGYSNARYVGLVN